MQEFAAQGDGGRATSCNGHNPARQALKLEACILGIKHQWWPTALYGFAHLGKSLFWYSSEILFAYFLTELVGLPTSQMGIVLASGFVVSAVIDLAVGYGLQRWLTSAAEAARMQLAGSILCSAALLVVFLGAWVPPELRFAYAVTSGIGFRLAFATYDIPQNALMALATVDRESRLRIASIRIWFSGTATLIVAAAVGPMVAMRGSGQGPGFLLAMTLVFALVAITSAARLTKALDGHALVAPRDRGAPAGRLPAAVLPLLIALMIVTSVFTPAFGKLEPYFATYSLQSAWWGGAVILLMAVGIVVGQPLWLVLCKRIAKPTMLLLGAAMQIVALGVFWLAGAANPPIAAAAAFLFGLGNGAVGMAQWAAFSDAVAKLPPERSGPSYGLFAASAKIGLAAGSILLSALLSAGPLSPAGAGWIVTLMAVIPGVGAVAAAAVALAMQLAKSGSAGGVRERQRVATPTLLE